MPRPDPDRVVSRDDFERYMAELHAHPRNHPEEAHNSTLDLFLEAMGAWVKDMDGYFRNRGEAVPDASAWRLLARIVSAALVYE